MDPVSAIVAAVSAGATVALKDVSSQAIKEAYASVRDYISGRTKSLSLLESAPDSDASQTALATDIQEQNLDKDGELLGRVAELLDRLLNTSPGQIEAWGVKLDGIRAAGNVFIRNLESQSGGVSVTEINAGGDATLDGIRVIGRSKN